MVLFRCDQCSYEEWREAHEEPWLCVVCGWMRWSVIAEEEVAGRFDAPSIDAPSDDDSGSSKGD